MEVKYINSNISDTAMIYENVRIVNSMIGDFCCIGDDCDICDSKMDEHSEVGRRNLLRNVSIGKGSYTGTNTVIKNCKIGKFSSISWNVSIGGMDHKYENVSMYSDYWFLRTFSIMENYDSFKNIIKNNPQDSVKSVEIGNDVWIGSGVIINNGVKIGNGCVIGAGAVITKDIEPYSIIVGVPGRVLRKRFDKEIIKVLEELKWWDWDDKSIVENIDLLRSHPDLKILKELLGQ